MVRSKSTPQCLHRATSRCSGVKIGVNPGEGVPLLIATTQTDSNSRPQSGQLGLGTDVWSLTPQSCTTSFRRASATDWRNPRPGFENRAGVLRGQHLPTRRGGHGRRGRSSDRAETPDPVQGQWPGKRAVSRRRSLMVQASLRMTTSLHCACAVMFWQSAGRRRHGRDGLRARPPGAGGAGCPRSTLLAGVASRRRMLADPAARA